MNYRKKNKDLGNYIIQVKAVNKVFQNGVHALRDFTTDIRRSEVLVIIGPSGSGKSTLLRCLNGLERIDSGSISVDGILLDDNKANRLEIRKRSSFSVPLQKSPFRVQAFP